MTHYRTIDSPITTLCRHRWICFLALYGPLSDF